MSQHNDAADVIGQGFPADDGGAPDTTDAPAELPPDPQRRLSIHLIGKMAALVRELGDRSDMRVSDVVKAAVASFEFLDEHARRGEQIFIEDKDGRFLKVPWPPRSPQ